MNQLIGDGDRGRSGRGRGRGRGRGGRGGGRSRQHWKQTNDRTQDDNCEYFDFSFCLHYYYSKACTSKEDSGMYRERSPHSGEWMVLYQADCIIMCTFFQRHRRVLVMIILEEDNFREGKESFEEVKGPRTILSRFVSDL